MKKFGTIVARHCLPLLPTPAGVFSKRKQEKAVRNRDLPLRYAGNCFSFIISTLLKREQSGSSFFSTLLTSRCSFSLSLLAPSSTSLIVFFLIDHYFHSNVNSDLSGRTAMDLWSLTMRGSCCYVMLWGNLGTIWKRMHLEKFCKYEYIPNN